MSSPTKRLAELAAVLRMTQRTLDVRMDVFGNLERTTLMNLIILGTLDGKEWNLSSLASRLRVDREVVHRAARKLARDGYVTIRNEGRSKRLHATERGIEHAMPIARKVEDLVARGIKEIRAIRAR
jgi:Mn-dependent DtxR family transcriptional regulator